MEIVPKLSRQDIGHLTDLVRGAPGSVAEFLTDQLDGGRREQLRVHVDVGVSCRRAHQGHVVERRDQDAPVGQVQVQIFIERLVRRGIRFAA